MSHLLERNVGTLAEDVISAETQHLIPGQHPESDGPALSTPFARFSPPLLGMPSHLSGFMVLICIGKTTLPTCLPPRVDVHGTLGDLHTWRHWRPK